MFKEGDRVKIKSDCSGTIAGHIYKLKYGNLSGSNSRHLFACLGELKKGGEGCSCQSNWILAENKKFNVRNLNKDLIKNSISKKIQSNIKSLMSDVGATDIHEELPF